MDEKLTFELFGRENCHLCQDMADLLRPLSEELGIEVLHVDIDSDPALAEHYNELVPVLVHRGREISRYHLNIEALRAYLAEIR